MYSMDIKQRSNRWINRRCRNFSPRELDHPVSLTMPFQLRQPQCPSGNHPLVSAPAIILNLFLPHYVSFSLIHARQANAIICILADIPLFVQKAMKEHDKAMAKYKKQLQEFQRLSSSTSTDQVIPTPPNPPKPMVQFKLANRRQYPETIDSPHSPFRVSFMTSKKIVSKLATDRNMVRKKLVAAVEMVFRGDTVAAAAAVSAGATSTTITATPTLARPGYEYLIFPKRAVMWTTQEKLMELMVKELQNPRLYGERDTSKSKSTPTQKSSKNGIETPESVNTDQLDTFATAKEEHSKSMISDPEIKFRWKYNQPPTLEPFWKHSLPNPLSRVHQSNAYLNRFCPDAQEALAPIRQKAGRQRKAAIIYQSKIQRRRSKRS